MKGKADCGGTTRRNFLRSGAMAGAALWAGGPLVSEQHGTAVLKSEAPSQPGHGDIWASVFASYGYAVVVPDYLGLGSSPGYQAYLHARSEATCVVDALRAGKALCASNKVTLNGQLFLTGYSQGGSGLPELHQSRGLLCERRGPRPS